MTDQDNLSEPDDREIGVQPLVNAAHDCDDSKITCWCGAVGTADELFDDYVYSQTCGGSGYLNCECGGDFCVCHHHGEIECGGCEDCEDPDDYYEDWYDDYGDESR